MKYFIFSFLGDGFPIAYKLQQEGHDVIVGQVDDVKDIHSKIEGRIEPEDAYGKEGRLSLYNNMLKKMPAWELVEYIKKMRNHSNSFVFFDRNNLFKFASQLMHLDIKGNFPTEEDYLFEHDRDEAKQFVKKHYPKLHVADVREFAKISEAKKFLKDREDIWVLKGKSEKARTFIPDNIDPRLATGQIIQTMEAGKADYEAAGFILEKYIESMIELTPEKIYYDGKPIAITVEIENKPFGSGNTSVQTGCAQDLVFPVTFKDRIHDIAFPSIVDKLAKKHKGLFYWDASLLIDMNTDKIYFGEFCSNRAGYNTVFTEMAQCESISYYFERISQKKSPFALGTVASSVTLFNPDQDENHNGHPPRNAPIDYKKSIEKDLWLWDVYKKGRRLVTVGDTWELAVITGSGKSINDAVSKMYKNVDDFSFVGSYNRPKFDYVSLDYPTSIPNRLNYGLEMGLYRLPFYVKVGEIQ